MCCLDTCCLIKISVAKVRFFYKSHKFNAQKPAKRAQIRWFAQ